jgi:hypothetical protein
MAVQGLLNADFSNMTGQEVLAFIKQVEAMVRKLTKEDAEANADEIKALKAKLKTSKEIFDVEDETKDLTMEIMNLEQNRAEIVKSGAAGAKDMVDNLKSGIQSIPIIGGVLSNAFDFDKIGASVQKNILQSFSDFDGQVKETGSRLLALFSPTGLALFAAGLLAVGAALVKLATQVRDLSRELNVSFVTAAKLNKELVFAQGRLTGTGLEAKEIAKELIDTFGTLENVTARNIRNVGLLATRFGAATKDIIQVQKDLSDLFGMTADQSEVIVRNIGKLADASGVAAGQVIADLASSSEKFAEFASDGAMGFAQAAIEARKVGTSLDTILGAADKLLSFEESISAQFEAQVLTGRQLSLEKARQLALDNDTAGLVEEIQSIVSGVGEIETLNAIERRSIADAIGISVRDLQRIARGEEAQEAETVQNKIDQTNKILMEGLDVEREILENTKDNKTVNIAEAVF